MKILLRVCGVTLIWALPLTAVSTAVSTEESAGIGQSHTPPALALDEAYLFHWFSIDSSQPLNLSLLSAEDDKFENRKALSFNSDDAQPVNGSIAFPKGSGGISRLALLLHPMGTDQGFWWRESPLAADKITARLLEPK